MSLTFQLDDSQFRTQLARYVDELGLEAKDVVRDQTRLLLKSVIAFTPPKTQAQGRKAVARDVSRAMRPIAVDHFTKRTRDRIEVLIKRGDNTGLQALLRDAGRKDWTVQPFSTDLHKSIRAQLLADKRFRARVFIPGTTEGGRAKSGAAAQWFKYVAEVQKNVGRLKAAWGVAYQAVGGSLPAWITRHASPSGAVNVNFSDSQRPFVEFRNFAGGVGNLKRPFQAAFKYRAEAMRRDIAGRLKRAAQKAGFR